MNKLAMFRMMLMLICYTSFIITCTLLLLQAGVADQAYQYITPHGLSHRVLNLRWFSSATGRPSISSNLCNGSFAAWNNITDEASCESWYGEATEKPSETTPPGPKYLKLDTNEELDLHCNRCALVFSSGHLANSKMGQEIDATECVIRQNTATIHNYWKDVGTRTTVRVIGHPNLKDLLKSRLKQGEILYSRKTRPEYIVVPWLYEVSFNRTTDTVFRIARDLRKKFPDPKFYFQSDERMKEMDAMFMTQTGLNRSEIDMWFSTGYLAMVFALDVCDNVVCYGLADADYCSREPKSEVSYHYYDLGPHKLLACSYINERENMVKGGHKFLTERRLYARWALERNLTFRAPTWPVAAFNVSGNFTSPYLSVYTRAKEDGSFANYSHQALVRVKDPKEVKQPKVRQPLLRKIAVKHRSIPAHVVRRKYPKQPPLNKSISWKNKLE